MMSSEDIFRNGSKTFYVASLFFPRAVRLDVTRLYAFVRTADDFVDQMPQDKKGFLKFMKQTQKAFVKPSTVGGLIGDFVLLCQECGIEKEWVYSFLAAMEKDLTKRKYATYSELEEYMYGSAEVIGLMMARILRLPARADESARLQGKAMQLVNFIRDVKEDIDLGRQYLPQEDLERFGIKTLSDQVDREAFSKLTRFEIKRYRDLQKKASVGYGYIPRASRVPIATAASMYSWTADQIEKDPMLVFGRKIKPRKIKIIIEYLLQSISR